MSIERNDTVQFVKNNDVRVNEVKKTKTQLKRNDSYSKVVGSRFQRFAYYAGFPVPSRSASNWWKYSLFYAINNAMGRIPMMYAGLEWNAKVSGISVGTKCAIYILCSLTFTPWILNTLSPKMVTVVSQITYAFAAGVCFNLASFAEDDSFWQWFYGISYGVISGICSSTLWSAWSVYHGISADNLMYTSIDGRTPTTRDEWTLLLASSSASTLFICEMLGYLIKILLDNSIQDGSKDNKWIYHLVYFFWGFFAFLAALGTWYFCDPIEDKNKDAMPKVQPEFLSKIGRTVQLWRDGRVFLFGIASLGFGFSASLMNAFVNPITGEVLAKTGISYGTFTTSLTALIFTKVIIWGMPCIPSRHRQVFGVSVGALGMIVVSWMILLSSLLMEPEEVATGCGECLLGSHCMINAKDNLPFCRPDISIGGLKYGLFVLYSAQGFVRAVYESVNKAVYADYFPLNKEGSSANQMIMCVVPFAIVFFLRFLGAGVSAWYLSIVVLVLGVITVPTYLYGIYLSKNQLSTQTLTASHSTDSSEENDVIEIVVRV